MPSAPAASPAEASDPRSANRKRAACIFLNVRFIFIESTTVFKIFERRGGGSKIRAAIILIKRFFAKPARPRADAKLGCHSKNGSCTNAPKPPRRLGKREAASLAKTRRRLTHEDTRSLHFSWLHMSATRGEKRSGRRIAFEMRRPLSVRAAPHLPVARVVVSVYSSSSS